MKITPTKVAIPSPHQCCKSTFKIPAKRIQNSRRKKKIKIKLQSLKSLLRLVRLGSSCSSLSPEPTSSPGSNKTNLLPWWSITSDSAGMTNVLMVTTTVGMFHGVHGNTTDLRPAVPLDPVLVICITSLKQGLFGSSSPGNLTNHGTATTRHNPFRS